MTSHGPASGPDSRGLPGQIVCANTIVYCEKRTEAVAFYRTGLQLPVTVSRDWVVEFRLTDTARLSIADAGSVKKVIETPFTFRACAGLHNNLARPPAIIERFNLPQPLLDKQIIRLSGNDSDRCQICA